MSEPQARSPDATRVRHLLDIGSQRRETLDRIFELADSLGEVAGQSVKKVPLLRGKTIVLLFFEASTRTRTTFEIAAKRLSADVVTINTQASATRKGESLLDTVRTLEAMSCDMFVVRHADSGAPHLIARHVAPHVSVINAGDGCHAHPTQALLDLYTLRQHRPQLADLRVAVVGDVLHSRVARSQVAALRAYGVRDIRLVGPRTLVPDSLGALGARICHSLEDGLRDVDVVLLLRLQHERMASLRVPDLDEYYAQYGLTRERLAVAAPDVRVMHPGPINRGVEIESELADDERSLILDQVSNGIAVRMAVMALTLGPAAPA